MKLSAFGERFTSRSGILGLMDDLGNAMAGNDQMCMLGGGNPSHIPGITDIFRKQMLGLLESPGSFERLIGNYDPPQGNLQFIDALSGLLKKELGWHVGRNNIAITNGSQSAFFSLFNMFAGETSSQQKQRILLPLAPEYIGYADLGLEEGMFLSRRPIIEEIDQDLFKYHVDFKTLEISEAIGAMCVSRPTNPTGNVLTDSEIERLNALADQHDIPLIIDNAYGTPFPDIIFSDARPFWNDNIIVCMSLSKLGLPGTRTGIVIANEEVISLMTSINAVLSLASGNLGAVLATRLVENGEILRMSQEVIKPYYLKKSQRALAQCRQAFVGLDYRIHKPEGAMFLWLWFPGLPIDSETLYQRLKARGVLVVAGHHFFPGLEQEWQHRYECIRVTYTQDEMVVQKGVEVIAEEVRKAYAV